MGPLTSVGYMVDNHVKEKGLPPLKNEFLDALGLGDVVLESLFGKPPPIEEDHLVALVSGVRSRSQQLVASLALIMKLSLPAQQSEGTTNCQVGLVGAHNEQWLDIKVIVSLGQLLKLTPELGNYLTHHILMLSKEEPQSKKKKGFF
jgi:hypothetical protein